MKILSFFAATAAMFLSFQPAFSAETVVNKGVIDKDTAWSGEILIKGDVQIAKNVTLTIMPGTIVRFAKVEPFGPDKLFPEKEKENHFPRAELFIQGKLLAQGSREKKITFTSAEKEPKPGDWGGINFNSSVDNVLEHCVILYADTGVHAHSSKVKVASNEFKHNGTAIGNKNLKDNPIKCEIFVENNLITENGGGVVVGDGMVVSHNEISKNEFFGIYGKNLADGKVQFNNISGNGKGVILYAVKAMLLSDNNITDSKDYNLSMLEGQANDLAFPKNWWGTADESKIREKVLDKIGDSVLGKADLSNFYTAAVAGAGIL
ncbi:MAG: copper-binding protein (NosD) [Candidatus Electronema aureum]|uniref:Copper-binding protein (NosD) n=1 Tax=Candidatus Electronema aureum TaxID=2005002 RepID=A0A521G5J9_9BACT|nr:MAG: copper-binding protein (NosD) [Candidatus Electronema aureum]